ncbi:MAG TPA: methyltransferase [Caulobacteraceae bacterium]|jgi:predicted nicotinamide N-methyase
MIDDPEAFIRQNTALQPVPHAPEIRLYVADEVTPIWKMTEQGLGALGIAPPFWAFAWAGGQALARYVLDNPEIVAGKAVLDFAAGSGLVAIAAMKAGAAHTMACDIDPFCRAAILVNAEANGVAVEPAIENLLDRPPPAVDVILAGDICYERKVTGRVLAWLQAAHDAGVTVLIGDPGRNYFPKSGLEHLAQYEVRTTRELEDFEIKRTGVWTFPS